MVKFIETYTGRRINPLDPDSSQICIEDIAHALSMCCRFTGHTRVFYSVADHCIRVGEMCRKIGDRYSGLAGLLHDAGEAYLHDIASPLKYQKAFQAYREAEVHLEKLIYDKYGVMQSDTWPVKNADRVLVRTEGRDLMPSLNGLVFGEETDMKEPLSEIIVPRSQKKAEKDFLALFFRWGGRD